MAMKLGKTIQLKQSLKFTVPLMKIKFIFMHTVMTLLFIIGFEKLITVTNFYSFIAISSTL